MSTEKRKSSPKRNTPSPFRQVSEHLTSPPGSQSPYLQHNGKISRLLEVPTAATTSPLAQQLAKAELAVASYRERLEKAREVKARSDHWEHTRKDRVLTKPEYMQLPASDSPISMAPKAMPTLASLSLANLSSERHHGRFARRDGLAKMRKDHRQSRQLALTALASAIVEGAIEGRGEEELMANWRVYIDVESVSSVDHNEEEEDWSKDITHGEESFDPDEAADLVHPMLSSSNGMGFTRRIFSTGRRGSELSMASSSVLEIDSISDTLSIAYRHDAGSASGRSTGSNFRLFSGKSDAPQQNNHHSNNPGALASTFFLPKIEASLSDSESMRSGESEHSLTPALLFPGSSSSPAARVKMGGRRENSMMSTGISPSPHSTGTGGSSGVSPGFSNLHRMSSALWEAKGGWEAMLSSSKGHSSG